MADSTAAARPPAGPAAAAAAPGLGMSALHRFLISALVAWFATLYFRDGTVSTSSSPQQPTAHSPAAATQIPTAPAVPFEQPNVLLTTFTAPAEYDEDGFVKQPTSNAATENGEQQQTAVAPEAAELETVAERFDETVLPGDKIDATAVRSFSRDAAPHVTVRYCSS
jgi:hypothetical protein